MVNLYFLLTISGKNRWNKTKNIFPFLPSFPPSSNSSPKCRPERELSFLSFLASPASVACFYYYFPPPPSECDEVDQQARLNRICRRIKWLAIEYQFQDTKRNRQISLLVCLRNQGLLFQLRYNCNPMYN